MKLKLSSLRLRMLLPVIGMTLFVVIMLTTLFSEKACMPVLLPGPLSCPIKVAAVTDATEPSLPPSKKKAPLSMPSPRMASTGLPASVRGSIAKSTSSLPATLAPI